MTLRHTRVDSRIERMDKEWIKAKAEQSYAAVPRQITDAGTPLSPGGPQDYYSNGDYWWPNPDTADGLPYVRRDGESNPQAFLEHRVILRSMRTHVANLAAGYMVTGDERYAERAVQWLKPFFLDETTRMNPHLLYAQAIPGVCTGRGIGIIDTLHLIDVPYAVEALEASPSLAPDAAAGIRRWFADYLTWMSTHPYGIDEMNTDNNHSVCWFVQAAVFARFTGNEDMVRFCRERYKNVILPEQMAADGSFPRELGRTKPYGYSIFQLDNVAILCHVLSTEDDNLWSFTLADGRGIARGFDFLMPYLTDKSSWPYAPDVEHFDGWPARMPGLLFAARGLDRGSYEDLYEKLDKDPADPEIRRNISVRQPILWL